MKKVLRILAYPAYAIGAVSTATVCFVFVSSGLQGLYKVIREGEPALALACAIGILIFLWAAMNWARRKTKA